MDTMANELIEAFNRLVGTTWAKKRYLIAVSGGRDSMALLSLMSKLLPRKNLLVAHFDHGVRGKASIQDARFVRNQAKGLGIIFVTGKNQSLDFSEAGLRESRLSFLKQVKRDRRMQFVVTAHHANDQLETFLMRLMRGCGRKGLLAIAPRNGVFLRPLLDTPKSQIRAFVKRNKIVYREDETNHSFDYFRNRIRHRLMPAFESLAKEYGSMESFYRRFNGLLEDLRQGENF